MNLKRLLISLLVLTLAACAGSSPPAPGDVAGSDEARLTTAAPADDLQATIAGNTAFATDLYRSLSSASGNLFFSPYSISVALSMTYAGSANATKTAFETTLHQSLPAPKFHAAMNDLDQQLTSRGQGALAADGQPFRLNVTNQLFAQKGFSFEHPFPDTLALDYGSNVRLMDFKTQAEAPRVAINDWVAQRTEDRIKDLIPQGAIDLYTRAVLVNAIYFNAAWATQFKPANTANGNFTLLSGSTKSVPMMHEAQMPARAAQVNGVEAVALDYDKNQLSMLILMPPAGQLSTLEASLNADAIASYRAALQGETLTLSMPSFEVRNSTELSEVLSSLGLGLAFDEVNADFTAMSTQQKLHISGVIHQAFAKVGETGTEAAAATAVIVATSAIGVATGTPRIVNLDHPFVFLIQDNATGAVVFEGRIVEP